MADEDNTNQPVNDQPKPGETPDGSTVGPQPTPEGVDENVAKPGEDQVKDTGPKAGPNSEGEAPAAPSEPEAPAEPAADPGAGVQTSSDLNPPA